MELQRLTGPDAGVLKYDLLTALSVAGLNGSPTLQTSLMRLMALVTARYNWRTDEVSMGQRDIARMWSVNERTVKREMKRLTSADILICKRGGVRGRVGAYRLNYHQIARLSEPCWSLVGPDFEQRMRDRYRPAEAKVVQLHSPLRDMAPVPPDCDGLGTWHGAMSSLAQDHPNLYKTWFSRLTIRGFHKGVLRVKAPSSFIQRYLETHLMPILLAAMEKELGPVSQVQFED